MSEIEESIKDCESIPHNHEPLCDACGYGDLELEKQVQQLLRLLAEYTQAHFETADRTYCTFCFAKDGDHISSCRIGNLIKGGSE